MTDIETTTAQVADAIAADGEQRDLLAAMTRAGAALPTDKISLVVQSLGQQLTRMFPKCDQAQALAAVSTVAANAAADIVMQIERSHPMGDAARDGRVRAVATFTQRLIERAVTERAMLAKMDAKKESVLKGFAQ